VPLRACAHSTSTTEFTSRYLMIDVLRAHVGKKLNCFLEFSLIPTTIYFDICGIRYIHVHPNTSTNKMISLLKSSFIIVPLGTKQQVCNLHLQSTRDTDNNNSRHRALHKRVHYERDKQESFCNNAQESSGWACESR